MTLDVVGYLLDGIAHVWCGSCRRWQHYATPDEWRPFSRPAQCAKYQNLARKVLNTCPTVPTRTDPYPMVTIWPVRIPNLRLTAGDGLYGHLPHRPETFSTAVEPEVRARIAHEVELPRAAIAVRKRAMAAGWTVEAWYCRGTDPMRRDPRVTELVSLRMRREQDVLVMSWEDGKFAQARGMSGMMNATAAKKVIDERNV